MIDNKILDEINDKTDIVALVGEFVELRKVGKNYSGLCPFHNDTNPSFSVSPEKNIAKCMSCGEGGRPINFYRKIKNIPFEEAAAELAERLGIDIGKPTRQKEDPDKHLHAIMEETVRFYMFNLKNSTAGHAALDYLHKRGLNDALIDHFRIGFAPSHGDTLHTLLSDKGHDISDVIALGLVKQNDKGAYYDMFAERVIFPITDPKGRVVGLSGRTLSKTEKIKYVNSPETSIFKKGQLLYHFHEALQDIRKEKHILLYEGFFDVIQAYGAGVRNGVATMGTSLTPAHISLIRSVTSSVIISFDADNAGLKAADAVIGPLTRAGLKTEVMTIPEKMDPDEFIRAYGPEAYERLFSESLTDPYRFRYTYYRSGLDLSDANDRKTFKDRVLRMLKGADVSVSEYYRKKLAKDLDIDEAGLKIPSSREPQEPRERPKPEKKSSLPDRYERAERHLIIAMLKHKETARYVQEQLKTTDFVTVIGTSVRFRIETAYEMDDTIDVIRFSESLPDNERTFMMDVLLKDLFWTRPVVYKQEEIDTYIRLVKNADKTRRLKDLNEAINAQQGQGVHPDMLKERDRLILELKKKPTAGQ